MQTKSQRRSQEYIHSVAQLIICLISPGTDCSRKSQVHTTDRAYAASLLFSCMLVSCEPFVPLQPSGNSIPSSVYMRYLQAYLMECYVVTCCPHALAVFNGTTSL